MNIIRDEQNEKLPRGKGFYIALLMCIMAVFAVGFSTYRNFQNMSDGSKNSVKRENSSKENQEISKQISNAEENFSFVENENIDEEFEKADIKPTKKYYYNESLTPFEQDDLTRSVLSDNTKNLIVYPTNNSIIKEFSDGKPVYSKTLGDWRVHDGVDLKADKGSIVKSITSGTVKDVYSDPSYGVTIIIDHDLGFSAYYSGLGETTLVKKGDKVNAGDDIGSINDIPIEISDGPHLHLMINQDGKFIDPILVIEKDIE